MKKSVSCLLALVLALALSASAWAEPVSVYPKSIKLSKKTASLVMRGGSENTLRLSATTVPPLSTLTEKIIWSTDDESIATVDDQGLVKAVGEGATKVRASIKGATRTLTVSCKLTVKAVRVTSITLGGGGQMYLDHTDAGERSKTLTAKVSPPSAAFQQVAWTSSDPSVATVDNGVVTAVGAGICKVTASVDKGRKSAVCDVTVRDKSGMVSIVISAGGDVVLGGDKIKGTDVRFEQMISQSGAPDYGYVLKNLKQVFDKDDITILNLEGPLKGGSRPRKGYREFNFYGKPEYAQILTEGSVEVANVVNNHMDDYGTKYQTKQILVSNGIKLSDNVINSDDSLIKVNGVVVGFIGIQTPASASAVRSKVRKAKAQCDVLIVSMHFCDMMEHTHRMRSPQITAAHAAINNGAAMVLGHHTHVTSGIELYRGKYIYYGLGAVESSGKDFSYLNFITQQTLLVDKKTGYVEPQVPTIYPICPSSAPSGEPNNCQPMLLSPGDTRYDKVIREIDTYSNSPSIVAAPYIKGTP